MPPSTYSETELVGIVADVTGFVHKERARFRAGATALHPEERAALAPFCSPALLAAVRVTTPSEGSSVYNPAFYYRARQRGFDQMPDFMHQSEITFGDVIVLQDRANLRSLFHGIVHAAQYRLLGIERYVDTYVRAFVRTGIHVTVPFEVHAFELDHRFTSHPEIAFSIEDEVGSWEAAGRYGA